MRTAFDASHWLIQSYNSYLDCFLGEPLDVYPGIYAMVLGSILVFLADRFHDPDDPDPEIRQVREKLPELGGALELIMEAKEKKDQADFWTLISLAELRVLTARSSSQVGRAYRKAVAVSRENVTYMQAALGQLDLFRSLQMRPEFVKAGMEALQDELTRVTKRKYVPDSPPEKSPQEPAKRVFLFTGTMVDHEGSGHKLPPEKEPQVREAILKILEKHNAGGGDLAVTAGLSAGSEILFVECCIERGIPVRVHLPLTESAYVRDFVSPGGEAWVERFYKARNHRLVTEYPQPDCVGLPREGDHVHDRNNRWTFYTALGYGIDHMRPVAVWDGRREYTPSPDGRRVAHMVRLMHETGRRIEQVNPSKLPVTSTTG